MGPFSKAKTETNKENISNYNTSTHYNYTYNHVHTYIHQYICMYVYL